MKHKNEVFKSIQYKETMERFLLVLKMGLNRGYSKQAYEEALDTEIELVKNSLVWKYNYKYFNISFSTIDKCFRSVYAFDFLQEFCESETIELNLKNKCFFCDLWDPIKFFNINNKISFDSRPVWLKNLQIGRVQGDGNHKLFKAINNDEIKEIAVNVVCFDDTKFLKSWNTDGEYFYCGEKKYKTINERNAILFSLTKLKLGFVELEELYKQVSGHNFF